jgi:hypothetical protein
LTGNDEAAKQKKDSNGKDSKGKDSLLSWCEDPPSVPRTVGSTCESLRRRSHRLQQRGAREEDSGDSDCVVVDVCQAPGTVRQTTHVRPHRLSAADRNILLCPGQWLNDIHINLAHALLQQQFPEVGGLENCGLRAFSPCPRGRHFVQLLNTRGVHWMCVTNILQRRGGEDDSMVVAAVYDSFFRTLHTDTKSALQQILQLGAKPVKVVMPPYQKQPASQCGVFAIATATALLFGKDPSAITYDVAKMRLHLAQCFAKQTMKPFPELPKSLKKWTKRSFTLQF